MKKYISWILLLCILICGCNAKSSVTDKSKTLTLAVFMYESQLSGSKLLNWVNLYNLSKSDVNIDIINYLDIYSDPYEALNQLKIEIIAGKGPDIINFDKSLYSPIDASSGMLVNLYPFIQNDVSINKNDFYYNILESFAVGDGLYVLVPNFTLETFTTVNYDLSRLEKMDINQLVNAYNLLDDESILFPGETKVDVFAMICYGGLENYIDWNKGICHFDSDSFKEILNFANQFPLKLHISNDYSAKEFFVEGRALLYPTYINTVYGISKTRILFGKTPTYIGFPFDSGNGNLASIADIAIGISGVSNNKEEAWEFVRSLLDYEFQDGVIKGLPLRVNSLEKKLELAKIVELDSNGERKVKDRLVWEGEDPVNIYEIIDEDAETLKSIIRKVEFNATLDYNLYSIMLEEVKYLFNDNRNADVVADIIQNRVSLYMNERQ